MYYIDDDTAIIPESKMILCTTLDRASTGGEILRLGTDRSLYAGLSTSHDLTLWIETNGGPAPIYDDEEIIDKMILLADTHTAFGERPEQGLARFADALYRLRDLAANPKSLDQIHAYMDLVSRARDLLAE